MVLQAVISWAFPSTVEEGLCDSGKNAALWQVPVMVRVEVEKKQRLQFQVTVASPDGNTTSSLKDAVCQLLAKV